MENTLTYKYFHIIFVVAFYWAISILTVFVNKVLLSSDLVSLNAPLFVTWFQCIVSVILCLILKGCAALCPNCIYFPEGHPFKKDIVKKILPLSILFTGMIACNNLCLKHVGVAFYYIGRSLTTVFNVIFTFSILGERTSYGAIVCCLIIIFGFWLGVDQESISGSLSIIGTIYGVLGSLTLSLYSIHTKHVLPAVNQEIWLLSYYNNVYSIFIFIPLILINGEYKEIVEYNLFDEPFFWGIMIVGGICGFSIGYVTMLQIKVTSPLTHNISGTAKACVQTVLATYCYNESKPSLWWVSNFVVLFGSAAYARIKQLKMEEDHKKYTLLDQKTKI